MSKRTKTIIALAVLIVLVLGAVFAWKYFAPQGTKGDKAIDIVITHGDKTTKELTISTDEEFLRGALEQESLITGTEGEYGLFVTAVDGETADDSKQQWWCITKGGETVMTGVDDTPIADGEQFEITFKAGYDW